jgi:hypothetical protein
METKMLGRLCGIGGWALLVGGIAACGGARSAVSADERVAIQTPASGIAKVHKTRCGSCHVRVEPGERSRAELETAFTRHRRRLHLSEAEWGEMVDYLAVK